MDKRTYRPVQPSDYPQIKLGQLKAFCINHAGTFEVTLVSININSDEGTLWLVHKYAPKGKDYTLYGNLYIMVDVTPEKRYAVWDHKNQRFTYAITTGNKRKEDTEIALTSYCIANGGDPKNYYVVEWEIKDNV